MFIGVVVSAWGGSESGWGSNAGKDGDMGGTSRRRGADVGGRRGGGGGA